MRITLASILFFAFGFAAQAQPLAIPLFHLPEILGLGLRVRGWNAARWGAWKIDGVWLEARQP